MSMHRLTDDTLHDAEIIRNAMIDAKLEMLERLLAYSKSQFYLDGTPSEPIDMTTPNPYPYDSYCRLSSCQYSLNYRQEIASLPEILA